MAVGWFFLATAVESRLIGQQWLSAEFHLFFNGSHFRQRFIFSSGQTMIATAGQIVSAPFVQEAVMHLEEAARHSLWAGLIAWILSVVGVLIWLKKRGEAYTANKPLKGDRLCDVAAVKKWIRRQESASDLVFGRERLPLPQISRIAAYPGAWHHRHRKIHGD